MAVVNNLSYLVVRRGGAGLDGVRGGRTEEGVLVQVRTLLLTEGNGTVGSSVCVKHYIPSQTTSKQAVQRVLSIVLLASTLVVP